MPEGQNTDATGITISDSAAKRIAFLRDNEGNPNMMLRIQISGGGCSGFQYGFALDDTVNEDDQIFEAGDIKVIADETSLDLINGSELDYVEDLIGSYFALKNPNASSTCGCGSSFSV